MGTLLWSNTWDMRIGGTWLFGTADDTYISLRFGCWSKTPAANLSPPDGLQDTREPHCVELRTGISV